MNTDHTLSRRRLLASVPVVAAAGAPSVATALSGLAEGAEPIISHDELAAQDFEPVPVFVGFASSKEKQQKGGDTYKKNFL